MNHAATLLDRDRRVCWHPFTQHATDGELLQVVRAEGAWLELADGRRILDAISSWWTIIHGHGHPAIARAIARQATELDHVLFAGCTHPAAIAVAERLVALTPAPLARVFYSDDGSTAVEVALKMAFQYQINRGRPEKRALVALMHGYHGDTIGAMSVTDPATFDEPFKPLLFPVARVHAAHAHGCAKAPKGVTITSALGELEALFTERSSEIAAIIVEPMIQAAGGMVLTSPAWLRGVRALCDRFDVLLIADEVMTGFGRTGRMFAVEHAGIAPDLMCLSKGLSGGTLPLAATLTTEAIWEAFWNADRHRAFLHGHSFTANPIACAAALASLDIFETEPVLERVAAIERFYAERLPMLAEHPEVAGVRWLGDLGVVELAGGPGSYFDARGPKLMRAFAERGLLVRPLGRIIYTLPPYIVPIDALARVYDTLGALLSASTSA